MISAKFVLYIFILISLPTERTPVRLENSYRVRSDRVCDVEKKFEGDSMLEQAEDHILQRWAHCYLMHWAMVVAL